MTTPYLSPPVFSWPAAPGGKLHCYLAGGTTPRDTYSDAAGVTPNTNPVTLDSLGSAVVRLAVGVAYHFVLKDALDVTTLWDADNYDNAYLTSSGITAAVIGAALYPRTTAEITAGVTPTNYVYPPLLVDRYGTNTTPGTTDMTTAWQNAIAVAAVNGGTVTCLQTRYLISATLSIAGPASIDGGNSFTSYTLGTSAQLYATANIPILQYTVGSRFVSLRNINIVGNSTGAAQDGVQVGYNCAAGAHGIYLDNVAIFNCGNYGLKVINSVAGGYRNLYIQSCANGIVLINDGAGGTIGANRWYNINVTNCTSVGIDINNTAAGYDTWYGVTSEVNAYGIVFESGVVGQKMFGAHTERNVTQSVWFKAGSNKNFVDCETTGASESLPLNQGSAQNRWMGNWMVAGVFQDSIIPACIQRVSTIASTVVTAGGLSAYSATIAPTTGGGLLVLTQAITPKNTASKLVVRAGGVANVAAIGTMIVAVFASGSSTAKAAVQVAMPVGGVFTPFSIEYEFIAGIQNSAITFTVRIGSTTGADTVTAFGQFGGSIGSGWISVEEYLPTTG